MSGGLHQGIEIEQLRLQYLLAAEDQQLAREPGSVPGGIFGLHDILPQRLGIISERCQRELRSTDNNGEQVIEVMGDTADQPADRLHLLRMAELLLQLL